MNQPLVIDREAFLKDARNAISGNSGRTAAPESIDDLLIREFIVGIESVTTPRSVSFKMPRSAVEAVIRRLKSAF